MTIACCAGLSNGELKTIGEWSMIFDTHAHYDDEAFDTDREEILSGLSSHGIKKIVNIGVDIPTSKNSIELAEIYDFIYAVIGFHPSEVGSMTEDDIDWLRAHVYKNVSSDERIKPEEIKDKEKNDKVIAIGEIGLDYHWSESEEENNNQQHWFRRQIALAKTDRKGSPPGLYQMLHHHSAHVYQISSIILRLF